MTYETHDFLQGSPEWHANRAKCFNASELAAAAGQSKNVQRNELIRSMATGTEREFSEWVLEHVIEPGHRFERLARPLAEEFIGEDLYPSVLSMEVAGLSKRLGASLDGKTMDDHLNWEHKRLNAELAESLDQDIIPPMYHWQMEQGMMINGAARCLFTASAWDDNDQLIDIKHVWYESNPELRAKIIPTWKQAEADAANYVPVEVIPASVAAPTLDLPVVSIEATGSIMVVSNLKKFGVALNSFIEQLPKKPSTDQEFADCKAALGKLKLAEETLDSEEARALSQMSEIDEMRREKKLLQDLARTTRLALEKLVTAREYAIKNEIVQEGKDALASHIATLNTRLGRVQMPAVAADFAGAIKSKRTVASLRNAVDSTLAAAKIEASQIADKIQINLATLDEHKEHAFLFNDLPSLAMKSNDDLKNIIKLRISEHVAAEQKKLDDERARIRVEEEARAQEAVKAEQNKTAAAELHRLAVENQAQVTNTPPPAAIAPAPENTPASVRQSDPTASPVLHQVAAQPQAQDTAWKIAGLVADMQEIERVRVLQFCERVIDQREKVAA